MMGNKKLQVWLPLLFSVVMIVGMFFGYKLGSQGSSGKGFFASNDRSTLQEALDLIRLRYVDSISIDSLEGRAIQEMMSALDPHSVYFPPVELKEANEDLAGNFEGIGVEFNTYSDTVNVVYVIPGGPSEKSLQIGDKIIKVDDSLLAGRKLNTNQIKEKIRGKKGTKALLELIRSNKTIKVEVTRGMIPISSLDASYMLDKTTGYLKLNKFTDKSYEEFMEAMESLKKQGLQKLIFDLRGNGGGFMNEAVDMADEFLDGDKLVVYTEGVNSRKREYRCKRPGIFEQGKVIVLLDELSASASEVLAGALQDWCRATIMGRRSFGKGLVQEQYPLRDGSALRLTVARYYTPLGRSIQRSYANGKKIYMDDLWKRFSNGELLSLDSVKSHRGKAYTTICNDTVYAGDGITPNIFVPLDTSRHDRKLAQYLGEGGSHFVYNYYLDHKKDLDQYTGTTDFINRFDGNNLWLAFLANKKYSEGVETLNATEKELLILQLKAQLARYRWRNFGYNQVLNADDPLINEAIKLK